jgi:hypothetical protein
MAVEVRPVSGWRGRHQFVDVAFRLFGDDPNWVPPLRMSVLDRISPKNPANEHQVTRLWIAYRDGQPVGRIGACVDSFFNEYQNVSWGWVGFYEVVDDDEVVTALFEVAWQWLKLQGATTAVGPASFTTNDDIGLQVDGFEYPPYFLTVQNPRYYLDERQRKTLARLRARTKLTIRTMSMKDFDAEVKRLFEVYNAAWSKNWGFAPMPEAEIKHLAKSMKQLVDPDITLVVEKPDGEPVGVAIILPDVNEIMPKLRSGRLLPIGWYHLLRGVPKVTRVRFFALGIKPEHQTLALGPLVYQEALDRLMARSQIVESEASWILASNDRMNNAIQTLGGTRYKTWRLYQRPL